MSQPDPYVKSTDFTNLPDEQVKTKLDIEFVAVANSVDELCVNIGLIQRDDGALVNQIVTPDSLSQSVLNLIALSSFVVRGAWLTATAYNKGDVVTQTSGTYVAATGHTSGTFATDLSAGKWILLASTAASTAASYSVTGAVAPSEGIYKPAASTLGLAAGGLDVMRLVSVGSAVNYFTVTNSAAGGALSVAASGSDTNIPITITPKGSSPVNVPGINVTNQFTTGIANGMTITVAGVLQLNANSGIVMQLWCPSSSVNRFAVQAAATNFYPVLKTLGSDTNVGMVFVTKGAVGIVFNTNGDGTGNGSGNGITQLVVDHTASAVNWWSLQGSATGNALQMTAVGSDSSINVSFRSKGAGYFNFASNAGGSVQFDITHTASAVNNLRATGGPGGVAPNLSAVGTDTNINLQLFSKGSGSIIANGQTLAQFDSLSGGVGFTVGELKTTNGSNSVNGHVGLQVYRTSSAVNTSIINDYAIKVVAPSCVANASITNSYALYVGGPTISTNTSSAGNFFAIYAEGVQLTNGAQGFGGCNGIILTMPNIDATSSWAGSMQALIINGPTIASGGTATASVGLRIGNVGAVGITNSEAILIDAQSGSSGNCHAIQYVATDTNNQFIVDKNAWVRHSGKFMLDVTAQVDKASTTTLADVLTSPASLIAGASYRFEAMLPATAGASGGMKIAIGGTCTATDFTASGWNYNGTTLNAMDNTTTKGNPIAAATAVTTYVLVRGKIKVNAAGTLTLQMAQNASNGTNSSLLVGGVFNIERIS
jgi:hypothetical protein